MICWGHSHCKVFPHAHLKKHIGEEKINVIIQIYNSSKYIQLQISYPLQYQMTAPFCSVTYTVASQPASLSPVCIEIINIGTILRLTIWHHNTHRVTSASKATHIICLHQPQKLHSLSVYVSIKNQATLIICPHQPQKPHSLSVYISLKIQATLNICPHQPHKPHSLSVYIILESKATLIICLHQPQKPHLLSVYIILKSHTHYLSTSASKAMPHSLSIYISLKSHATLIIYLHQPQKPHLLSVYISLKSHTHYLYTSASKSTSIICFLQPQKPSHTHYLSTSASKATHIIHIHQPQKSHLLSVYIMFEIHCEISQDIESWSFMNNPKVLNHDPSWTIPKYWTMILHELSQNIGPWSCWTMIIHELFQSFGTWSFMNYS